MLAYAETQGEFLNAFVSEKGRKPSLKEFRDWRSEVKQAKVEAGKDQTDRDPSSASLIWHYADVDRRVAYIREITQATKWDAFISAMRTVILDDFKPSLLLQHEEGYRYAYNQAIAARDLTPMTKGHWARKKGYNRFRSGKPALSMKECISILNGAKLD